MDLGRLYCGSYINWSLVAASWSKKTVSSRLMLIAARKHLAGGFAESGVSFVPEGLPKEVSDALSRVPEPDGSETWGALMDAALAAEFEMLPYGERPPAISELRRGLEAARDQAGEETHLGRWFAGRRSALPGGDLPDDAGYLPV